MNHWPIDTLEDMKIFTTCARVRFTRLLPRISRVAAYQRYQPAAYARHWSSPDEWLYIYTDGSLLDFIKGAGAGVFRDLFSFYSYVGSHTTHYDGEIEVLHLDFHQLSAHLSTTDKAVIQRFCGAYPLEGHDNITWVGG
ncbi:hypothetical protein TNCV_4315381 [Trichonephila clavipes]|nr:hypothetical protein TNCV_4315381 [Trichonephila clavipes]